MIFEIAYFNILKKKLTKYIDPLSVKRKKYSFPWLYPIFIHRINFDNNTDHGW